MSGAILGCTFEPNRAQEQVINQAQFVNQHVTETLDTVNTLATQLASYRVPNLTFDVSLDAPGDYSLRDSGLPPILQEVTVDDLGVFPAAPGDIVRPTPAHPLFDLPAPPPDAPTPTFATSPIIYDPSFAADPVLLNPDVPVYGDHTGDIVVPVPRSFTLPNEPNIDLSGIIFQGVRPVLTATPPDASDFNYTETPYDPLLVTELKAKILDMIAGNSGITPVVEFQLWSREVEREEEQADRAEQEAYSQWAGRGFGLPAGTINAAIQQVRQNAQNQRNAQSRDKAIRTQDVLIDQLKFAVGQGVALEELWLRVWTSTQDRKLQAAKIASDIVIAVFNAQVAALQAEADVYKVDAEVYTQLINAELAKLQVYSEQLRARQLIGTLNQQDIDLYLARLKGVDTNTQIFVAEVQARNGILEGEKLKLEQVRMQIDKELAKLQASELQLKAWSGLLEGEQIKQSAWATRAQVYTAQIGAWDTGYRADIARVQSELAVDTEISRRFESLVQGYTAFANFNRARAEIQISSNESRVQAYTAAVQGSAAYNTALTQKMKSLSDALRDSKEIALKNGEINIQNILEASKLMENALATATQVLAQITSGFASAFNVGAHISDSSGSSFSCSTSVSQNLDSPP